MAQKTPVNISFMQRFFSALIHNTRPLQVGLGRLETYILKDALKEIEIKKPVYVCSLARSGTTIVLEMINRHQDVASHKYLDFPPVFTPYWWTYIYRRIHKRSNFKKQERAHQDGLMVSPDSPEAMEEPVWMTFFHHLHDPDVKNVLDDKTRHPEFEIFYINHIKKLLLAHNKSRYLAKGNYNITRLAYLQKIHPDARFILPVRHPVSHIASLMKQHKFFCARQDQNPAILKQLRYEGHFEFGYDRRPIHPGDHEKINKIKSLWNSPGRQDQIRGWAQYWAMMYHFMNHTLKSRPDLARSVLVVRYEDLCGDPLLTLGKIFSHADLKINHELLQDLASDLQPPYYYTPDFSDAEKDMIWQETKDIAARFGYTKNHD